MEHEVDEEIEYHIARRAEQLCLAGMSADDALLEARRRFGDVAATRDACISEDVSDLKRDRMVTALDSLRSDISFAWRSLKRAPAFTAVALTTLVIGIASVTTIVSFVYAYALKPLPYPGASRIVSIRERRASDFGSAGELSIGAARAIVTGARSFERIAVYETANVRAAVRGQAESLPTLFIDSSFAPMFGLRAQLGRIMTSDEIASNAPVVMISDALWRASFGGDTSIVGHPMRFGDELLTIVGVLPQGFRYPNQTSLWRPLVLIDSSDANITLLGKLAPGASRQSATNELALVAQRLARGDVRAYGGMLLSVEDIIDRRIGGAASLTVVIVGAAVFVLLIACSNVANLMLMRTGERRAEMAVRSAMGAGRGRLFAQSLAEPAILAVAAGLIGTLLSLASVKLLLRLIPTAGLPSWLTFGVDGGLLLIVVAIVTIVVLVIGLTPAREGTRFDLVRSLRVGGDSGVAGIAVAKSARRGMVVQLALSVVLFIAASLLVQTYRRLSSVDVGYPAGEVVEVRPYFDQQQYPSDTAQLRFANAVLDRVRMLAGAQRVAVAGDADLPSLSGIERGGKRSAARGAAEQPDLRIVADGDSAKAFATRRFISPFPRYFAVSDAYFETLGIPLLQGRGLASFDVAGSRLVAVVSRRFAATYWPQQSPLGHTIQFGARGTRLTVVGVVEDVRDLQGGSRGIQVDPRADAYVSARQVAVRRPAVLIRGHGDVSPLQTGAQAVVRRLDPNVLTTIYTLARSVDIQLSAARLFGALVGTFAISGLGLSIIGIYGIVAYGITQRTREIGIRIALGGTTEDVLSLVLRQALRFVTIGLAAGLGVSLLVGRGLRAMLFGVSPTDPLTYVVACSLFGAIAIVACYLPARRVTRVDPLVALRSD